MHKVIIPILFLGAALALGTAVQATAADKAAPPAKAAKTGAQPVAESSIAYEDLREHIGERIAVQTRFKTTRVGTLTKFSKVELTLSIDSPSGASEMTIPKDTVVRVTPAEAPAPAKH
jgi:hypothetical protein